MITLKKVLTDATGDAHFAEQLQREAKAALRDGIPSASWRQLMIHFAQNAAELDELSDPEHIADLHKRRRVCRTILTFTSAICPITIFSQDDQGATAIKGARRARKATPAAKARKPRKSATKAKRSAK